jgi:hypothetical protein
VSAIQNRPPSHRFALLACLVPVIAAGCSGKSDATPPPAQDYGSGIVSMEIVQRDMAQRRAQAAAAAEAAAAPMPAPRQTPVSEPSSRTGLVPVSTRGIIKPSTPAHRAGAKKTPATTAPTEPAAAPQGEPAAQGVVDVSVPVLPDLLLSAAAPGAPVDPSAPIFPSATVAARRLGSGGTTSGVAMPAVPSGLAPAAAPIIGLTSVDELSRIYSKEDPGVTPARLLTTTATAGLSMDATDVNTMELVINELGRVEQVKLAQPAKRMTDMLLLSGAKLWKFEPATKDGQPVRYRTTVSWQTTK